MKYIQEVTIGQPIDKVVEMFVNPDNLSKWMDGLESMEHMSGEPGEKGAKSKFIFKMGKREIEMIETIEVNNLPDEFTANYIAKGVFNSVTARFVKENENTTKYISENEFQFKGFMKLMGFLMPGAFKKQSMKYLVAFKNFVEKSA